MIKNMVWVLLFQFFYFGLLISISDVKPGLTNNLSESWQINILWKFCHVTYDFIKIATSNLLLAAENMQYLSYWIMKWKDYQIKHRAN